MSSKARVAVVGLLLAECWWSKGCLEQEPSKDWGVGIKWRNLAKGLAEARESGRPLMLIVHNMSCDSCKSLREDVSASTEIALLSAHFVMVNVTNEPECYNDAKGITYVPRVMFFTPEGIIAREFFNKLGNPTFKYYYPNVRSIVTTMIHVLELYPP